MKCLAVCQDELVIRTLDAGPRPRLRRRLHRREQAARAPAARRGSQRLGRRPAAGRHLPQGRRLAQHLHPHPGQRPPQPASASSTPCGTPAARWSTCCRRRATSKRGDEARAARPRPQLRCRWPRWSARRCTPNSGRSLTRARVQQYQRYFEDADRVLILLHNDPDPDAMASGLALRNLLRRTKTTAIIGALQTMTRPENLRMANLLDIHVETITPEQFAGFVAHRDRRRAAALLRRPARARRPRHRSPPRAARLLGGVQGHPRRLRLDVHDPHRAPARRRREHLGAHGDGDALRDQVRHAVLRAPDEPVRPRGVHLPVSAGRRGAHPQDGGRRNHDGAAGDTCGRRSTAASLDGPGLQRRASATSPREDCHRLRGRLLPAARRDEVDDRRRARQRQPDRVGAQPRLHAERRASS